jgi:hypothetical protein
MFQRIKFMVRLPVAAAGLRFRQRSIIQHIVGEGLDGIWDPAIAEQVFDFLEAQAEKFSHFSACQMAAGTFVHE